MANMKAIIPSTTLLNHSDFVIVWKKWLSMNNLTYVPMRSTFFSAFDKWLFQQGGRVVQRNKKKCIEFISAEDALVFKLRWAL